MKPYKMVTCLKCEGSGEIRRRHIQECWHCKGTGKIPEELSPTELAEMDAKALAVLRELRFFIKRSWIEARLNALCRQHGLDLSEKPESEG